MIRRFLDKCIVALERQYVRNSPISFGRTRAYYDGIRRAEKLGRFKSKTMYGGLLWCNSTDLLQREVMFCGMWEPELTEFIARTLKPGDVFVDVGANIGYFTILAARAVAPAGHCVSIEAMPFIAAHLEENVRLNSCTNVRVVRKAVMNQGGEVKIFAGRDRNIGASTTLSTRGYSTFEVVEAAPLHEILTDEEKRRARLIKIDVEGAEHHVIESLFESMEAFSTDVTFCIEISPGELRKNGTSLQETVERFLRLGFKAKLLELEHPSYNYLDHVSRSGLVSFADLSAEQRALIENRPHVDFIFSR